jgi:putative PEP-CTERM system integral membrane protein
VPVIIFREIGYIFQDGIIRQMFDNLSGMDLAFILYIVLGFILWTYTATLIFVMPVAVPLFYARAWWRGVRGLVAKSGWMRVSATVMAVVGVLVVSVGLTVRQPQHQAFALLETPPASSEEAQDLLAQQDAIRDGLLNAYLAPARYVSAVGEVYHVNDLFQEAFRISEQRAEVFQQAYEVVARPALYEPVEQPESAYSNRWENRVFNKEPARAAEMYEAFFDEPIIDGEREAVVHAVRATWSADMAQTAWQAVDDREVHLVRQEITIDEHGDWAEVELYEVYQNQTAQSQEVVYYFSLPESSVVTGVWLGNSADRDERFVYRVSPRGAAQELYRREVHYNWDPALVEQIGPRQYRLRVFPIEPQQVDWRDEGFTPVVEDAPEMHMWLTYCTFAGDDAWPLPRLAEGLNVYWDTSSVRLVNGQEMLVDGDVWLPSSVPATSPVEPTVHRVGFSDGEVVVARPALSVDLPALPDDVRLAVVLDRSRSMAAYESMVEGTLQRLSGLTKVDVDVYLTASAYRGEGPSRIKLSNLGSDDILYYGGQNAAELLLQFAELRAGDDYDAVLILTDGTGYNLASDGINVPFPDAPVWMVHMDGDLSLGYDDATLEVIQASGGGVAGDLDEALARMAVKLQGEADASYDVLDGYVWQVVPGDSVEGSEGFDEAFAPLAARRLILAEMYRHRRDLNQLDTLDYLHAIAVEHSVVTPYSSMIVLVTEVQQSRLDLLEKGDDRFLREHEDFGETLPEAGITAVPEPEEWLLLGLAAVMLFWYARKKWPELLQRRAA